MYESATGSASDAETVDRDVTQLMLETIPPRDHRAQLVLHAVR